MGILSHLDVVPFETKEGRRLASEFAKKSGFRAIRYPTRKELYEIIAPGGVTIAYLECRYRDKRTGDEIPQTAMHTIKGLEEEGNLEVSVREVSYN